MTTVQLDNIFVYFSASEDWKKKAFETVCSNLDENGRVKNGICKGCGKSIRLFHPLELVYVCEKCCSILDLVSRDNLKSCTSLSDLTLNKLPWARVVHESSYGLPRVRPGSSAQSSLCSCVCKLRYPRTVRSTAFAQLEQSVASTTPFQNPGQSLVFQEGEKEWQEKGGFQDGHCQRKKKQG